MKSNGFMPTGSGGFKVGFMGGFRSQMASVANAFEGVKKGWLRLGHMLGPTC